MTVTKAGKGEISRLRQRERLLSTLEPSEMLFCEMNITKGDVHGNVLNQRKRMPNML
jgi:hypothetical protein